MNDTFDFVMAVDHGKNGETRFIEFVKSERTENFGRFDKNHIGTFDHQICDKAVVKTHDGRNAGASGVV